MSTGCPSTPRPKSAFCPGASHSVFGSPSCAGTCTNTPSMQLGPRNLGGDTLTAVPRNRDTSASTGPEPLCCHRFPPRRIRWILAAQAAYGRHPFATEVHDATQDMAESRNRLILGGDRDRRAHITSIGDEGGLDPGRLLQGGDIHHTR